jgi:hypothetical protein
MAIAHAPVDVPRPEAPARPALVPAGDSALRATLPLAWAAYVGLNYGARYLFPRAVDERTAKRRKQLVDPAPYAFAIWGPIFLGQGAFAAFQATSVGRGHPRVQAARAPMLASFAFGALWPVAIGLDRFDLACGVLGGMLGTGVVAYRRLRPAGDPPATAAETAAARVPTSVYVGWLTLAAAVSVAGVAGRYAGVRPGGEPGAMLAIGALGVVAGAVAWRKRDPAYAAPIAWGLAAVAVEQRRPAITRAVVGAMAVAAAGVVAGLARR